MAVLPTPGSPISTGLFLVRRESTWMTRRISSSRPITGSSLPWRRQLRQIAAVFFERFVGGFGILGGDALAAADLLQGPHQALARDAELAEQLAGGAGVVGSGQQNVLHRDVVVLQPLGFFFGLGQQLGDALGDVDLIGTAGGAGHLGQPVHFLLDAGPAGRPRGCRPCSGWRAPGRLPVQQGQHQVLDIDLLVSMLDGDGLGGSDGFLDFFSESVEVHRTLILAINLSVLLSTDISISP